MGTIFEELIRKFAEQSNEEAGEHFTPRDVVNLMTSLIFIENGIHLKEKNLENIMEFFMRSSLFY
jgi:type I restriction enzyme M protein